jgi:hypothetical protein
MCGCKNGGGKKSVSVKDSSSNNPSNMTEDQSDLVFIQYTGTDSNKVTLRSKYKRSERYGYSVDEPNFWAYRADVPWLSALSIFKVVDDPTRSSVVNDLPPLESNTVAPDFSEIPVDVLPVDPIILANLKKNGYDKLQSVKLASDGELLSLKGMGDKRLKDLRLALNGI